MLERIVEFDPAYDKRNSEPGKNYGIHSVTLRFLLKGELGAVQFVIHTGWQLPHVTKEQDEKALTMPLDAGWLNVLFHPMAADLGYHSPSPMYDDQEPLSQECPVLGGVCYYDGSTLNAEPVFEILLKEGGEGVWSRLEEEYYKVFKTEAASAQG